MIRSDFAEASSQFPELARLCVPPSYTLPMLDRAQLAEVIIALAGAGAPAIASPGVRRGSRVQRGRRDCRMACRSHHSSRWHRLWVVNRQLEVADGCVALRATSGGIEGARCPA